MAYHNCYFEIFNMHWAALGITVTIKGADQGILPEQIYHFEALRNDNNWGAWYVGLLWYSHS